MSKSDHTFINLSEDHEVSGWLNRNGFSGGKENREEFKKIANELKGPETSKNLRWSELNNAAKETPSKFKGLDKK